jgi:hypothetical protein
MRHVCFFVVVVVLSPLRMKEHRGRRGGHGSRLEPTQKAQSENRCKRTRLVEAGSTFFIFCGGKEGNASCIVCGTPVRLASWSIRCLDNCRLTYPLKPSHAGVARPHPVREFDGRTCFKDQNHPTTFHETVRVPVLHQVP